MTKPTTNPIPFQNVPATHEPVFDDIIADFGQLLRRCDFIGASSRSCAEFECAFAGHTGAQYALGVASGTDALLLPLHALGVGPGAEVIMPAFGFIATADVVVRLGGRPVFADIDPATYNLDPAHTAAAITPRTRALIPVHLFGLTADMDAFTQLAEQRNIPILEDVAQATGATYNGKRAGSIGLAGAFSFYPTKNLGGAGDGGMITTSDPDLAQTLREFRDHGRAANGSFVRIGYNSRLDTIQALYLHRKLALLDKTLHQRAASARLYNELLTGTGDLMLPAIPEEPLRHSFNLYTIRTARRDELAASLKERGIATAIYYRDAMHLTPALSGLGYGPGDFPHAEAAAREVLSLPVWPGLTPDEVRAVANAVRAFFGAPAA